MAARQDGSVKATRAIEMECPQCKAPPVHYCVDEDGAPLDKFHRRRIDAAMRATRTANLAARPANDVIVEPLPPCRICEGCLQFESLIAALNEIDARLAPAIRQAEQAESWAAKHDTSRVRRAAAARVTELKYKLTAERWRLASAVATKACCVRIGFVVRRIPTSEQ